VMEDGQTLAENARIKASGYARQLGLWVLADDTGLEVDALGGAPGVRSARYAGERATMAENRACLLAALRHVPEAERTARFVCQLAVADPTGVIVAQAAGDCRGRIRESAAPGSFGFGYDVLFEVSRCGLTLAQLPPAETARLGHRGQAVRALLRQWRPG
jgi:XTP/dITP diphosphohydrolase